MRLGSKAVNADCGAAGYSGLVCWDLRNDDTLRTDSTGLWFTHFDR